MYIHLYLNDVALTIGFHDTEQNDHILVISDFTTLRNSFQNSPLSLTLSKARMDDGGHRENGRHRIDYYKGVHPQVINLYLDCLALHLIKKLQHLTK